MDRSPTLWERMSSPRACRRWLLLLTAAAAAVVAVTQYSPYLTEKPGPTPNLGAAVMAAQADRQDANPALTYDGPLLATTVEADRVSWGAWVLCRVKIRSCGPLHQLAAGAGGDTAMDASQQDAAAAARALVPARERAHPAATLAADLPGVDGPSAGLMLTLTFIDALSSGQLSSGGPVAGTGTIDPAGQTGPIGGVQYKVVAAAGAGARVFFVDDIDAPAARAAAPAGLPVVAVGSVTDALRWLCGHGATSSICAHLPAGHGN